MADQLHEFRMRYPYVAFAAVVLFVVVIFTIQSCAIKENRDTLQRIQQAEERQAADRAENRARFVRSDQLLCQEIEKIKARDRVAAHENRRNLDRNLRLLGIPKTPEIVQLADANLRRQLEETKPRAGGCRALPANR